MKKRVAFYTLGCKVNYCETESLEALFRQAGYTVADFEDVADVYVINTCTVTHLSDHKSRKMIRRARRRNPRGSWWLPAATPRVSPRSWPRSPGWT